MVNQGQFEEMQDQGPLCKRHTNSGPNLVENKGEIENFKSSMVN